MKRSRMPPIVAVLATAILGCGSPPVRPAPAAGPAEPSQEPAAVDSAAFSNRVWRVAESPQVQEGSLRIFLSDGTLVMADPHSEPALGSWAIDAGELTITEEGLTYRVEILELSEREFRIRIHSPGEPVDIRFEPATAAGSSPGRVDGWVELASEAEGPKIRIEGTVRHLQVEGGVWIIRTDEGGYQPSAGVFGADHVLRDVREERSLEILWQRFVLLLVDRAEHVLSPVGAAETQRQRFLAVTTLE